MGGALLKAGALALAAITAIWRRRRLRIGLLVALVLAPLLVGGWRWLRHSSLVAVRHVHISGVSGPEAHAIEAALARAARRMSTLDVHGAALRAAVASFPVVSGVRASASFPHTLRIRVSEQLPVAVLVAGGARTAVAADGAVLGPALAGRSLPTVAASRAPATGKRVSQTSLAAELDVLGAAPARLAPTVMSVFSGPRGVTLVFRSGLRAYFGDAGRPHAKWTALALVLAGERPAGAAYVDVRVPEHAAVGYGPGAAPPARSTTSASSSSTTIEAAGTPESITEGIAAGLAQAEGASGSASQHPEPGGARSGESSASPSTESAAESGSASTESGH